MILTLFLDLTKFYPPCSEELLHVLDEQPASTVEGDVTQRCTRQLVLKPQSGRSAGGQSTARWCPGAAPGLSSPVVVSGDRGHCLWLKRQALCLHSPSMDHTRHSRFTSLPNDTQASEASVTPAHPGLHVTRTVGSGLEPQNLPPCCSPFRSFLLSLS